MTVLLVAAEPREFAGLLRLSGAAERLSWPVEWARRAVCSGGEFVMVANGAGHARAGAATAAALERTAPDAVVSFGFCGALDPSLGVGDVFAATAVEAGERRLPAVLPGSERRYSTGVLASIGRVAQTAVEKAALRAAGADAVEMEAFGVAEQAAGAGLPFFCVRSVTDLAGESFALDLNSALQEDGHFATMLLLRDLTTRPGDAAPELFRLWKRCRIAARSLGEFVADCRF